MTKKAATLTAGIIATKGAAAPSVESATNAASSSEKLIPITVRLTPELYKRVKLFELDHRLTNQKLFVAAVEEYLTKQGA